MKTMNVTTFRDNIYNTLKDLYISHIPIEITNNRNANENAILISKEDWESILETLYLYTTGAAQEILRREKEDHETIKLEDIDWDEL